MKKFSRREFISSGLFSTALVGSGIALPGRAFAASPVCPGESSLRALISIELLGGLDSFALSIPTDNNRKNKLISRRPALTAYYSDPNLLDIGNNIAMDPAFKPLEDYIDNMRITMGVGNTLHISPTGSHAIAQNRMALGTSPQSSNNFGWKGRLYESGANLIGFEGSRGLNYNCETCRQYPPLVSRNYENYKLSGANFHNVQGGAANTAHVASVVEELATMPLSRPTSQVESDFRAAQQAMFSSIANVQNIVENYKTPLYDEYLVEGSNFQTQNALAIRFRNIAQTLLYMKCQGSSERAIFVVPQGGYDVHGNHSERMTNLLSDLVFSLKVFIQDLEAMELFDQTVITTETDFGRQIRANGSGSNAGTDHGRGFTNLTIGGKINGGTDGAQMLSAGQIETAHSWQPEIDSRAILAEIIEEHLQFNPEETAFPPPINGEFSRVALSLFK